ncbi:MAG: histidine kinase, partial [Rothia sp. (in: high G+C Gram-positive bacteria)]|nr:histidine kinase [Rothia sp. (in: high G+C Gram-positive bacteria)]
EQERVMAALDERARIAREMHDIVAHSLSTIIAQADGAQYAALASTGSTDERVEVTALSTISQAARSSLEQMRALLGVLRTDEVETFEPLPALHNVPQLIDGLRRVGIPVEFTAVEGVEARLPQGAELTVYRIVQEALTNVTKHCPGTPLVTVNISEGKDSLMIDVLNRPQSSPSPSIPGARRGLLGMRERIDMYGGSLQYGTLDDGSFRVFAQIPFAR